VGSPGVAQYGYSALQLVFLECMPKFKQAVLTDKPTACPGAIPHKVDAPANWGNGVLG